jgi:hypothetical protein
MARLPRGTDLYDRGRARGAELERARILRILYAARLATDEVCEEQQWRALDAVIVEIQASSVAPEERP